MCTRVGQDTRTGPNSQKAKITQMSINRRTENHIVGQWHRAMLQSKGNEYRRVISGWMDPNAARQNRKRHKTVHKGSSKAGKTQLYCLGMYKENYIRATPQLCLHEGALWGRLGTGKGHRRGMRHISWPGWWLHSRYLCNYSYTAQVTFMYSSVLRLYFKQIWAKNKLLYLTYA